MVPDAGFCPKIAGILQEESGEVCQLTPKNRCVRPDTHLISSLGTPALLRALDFCRDLNGDFDLVLDITVCPLNEPLAKKSHYLLLVKGVWLAELLVEVSFPQPCAVMKWYLELWCQALPPWSVINYLLPSPAWVSCIQRETVCFFWMSAELSVCASYKSLEKGRCFTSLWKSVKTVADRVARVLLSRLWFIASKMQVKKYCCNS